MDGDRQAAALEVRKLLKAGQERLGDWWAAAPDYSLPAGEKAICCAAIKGS
jgi:hypothetical protein